MKIIAQRSYFDDLSGIGGAAAAPATGGVSLAVPLIGEGLKSLYGLWQHSQAQDALDKLNATPLPQYQTGAQINSQAQNLATGLTPQEKASAQQKLNQLNNTRYTLGVQRNPNLSGAVQAGVNYGSVQSQLGLAAQDAQARRQNVQQLYGLLSGQANRQTGAEIQHRQQLEQRYGQAAVAGVQNTFSGINGAAGMVYNQNLNNQRFGQQQNQYAQYLAALRGMGGNGFPPPTPQAFNNQLSPSDNYNVPYEGAPTDYSSSSAYGN